MYKKLPIPKDSAWERKSIKKFFPIFFKSFLIGIENLIKWFSIIYKDRNFDDYYITKILQHKIEQQRKYLVFANRHKNVDLDNFWMTVVLNLLEKEHDDYYESEYYDYIDEEMIFVPILNKPEHYELKTILKKENLDDYLKKYPAAVKRVKKKYSNDPDFFNDKKRLAFFVAGYNQKRCRNLIFEILKNKSHEWWD